MCFSLYSLNACCLLSAQFVAILCEIILLYGRLTTKFFFRYVFVSFRNKAFCLRRQFFHSYMIKVVNECTIRNIERTSDNQFCLILKDTQFYLSVCFWFLYKGEKKTHSYVEKETEERLISAFRSFKKRHDYQTIVSMAVVAYLF